MEPPVLSDSQKYAIRSTWKILEQDMVNNGKAVFLRIFEQNPAVKQLFPFRNYWGDALIKDPVFQDHAYR